ncbi:hypothetical protein [Parasitella parasitica]|uniref:Uncharacterized protein n=1 Tax=Parasitella parasitica TaxID=35722 RepID=A0A0B7MQB7_9FUNG|nr:hypothetical protein [Parasitella parasitica]
MNNLELKDICSTKSIIQEQKKQIEDLERQLKEYKQALRGSSDDVKTDPSVASLPTEKLTSLTLTRKLKLVLPTRQTFKRRIKTSIELDGYNHNTHFQHLIYEDAKLPSSSKNHRWNFGFRFCSYFVHSNRKIIIRTLVNENINHVSNRKISVASFPGLKDYLVEKNIDANMLQKPLSFDTISFFIDHENQKQITHFLYVFCSFLYSFLPEQKRKYKTKGDATTFCLPQETPEAENGTNGNISYTIKQEDSNIGLDALKSERDNE